MHYEGRDYYGWQIQPGRRTVQGELSSLLGQLFGGKAPVLTGAGRTDQGVHATGQVASALVPDRFDEEELRRALNALAPLDLWIASAERVEDSFHPRYNATARTYTYRLGVAPETRSPFLASRCWPLGRQLDWERTDAAAAALVGRHDFSAFAKSGQPHRGVSCDVRRALWQDSVEVEAVREFEITANRYLHHMVRYLVGTLVDIGLGNRPLEDMAGLLATKAGLVVSRPAPAKGLFLTRVEYSREHIDNSR